MRMLIFLALSIAIVSAAPHPRRERCEAPMEWEGFNVAYDIGTHYYRRGHIAYDARGKQIRVTEKQEENSTITAQDNLYLFEKKEHYRIDLKTRKCSKLELNYTFIPIEIRPNATYIKDTIIGTLESPGSGVIVQTWRHKTADGEGSQIFTVMGCVPVETVFFGEHGGAKIHFHNLYYNVSPGIRDRAIFDVPKECM